MMKIDIRYAVREELEEINKIRKQVNLLHVKGRPDIFRADSWDGIQNTVYDRYESENGIVISAVMGDEVVGFAQVRLIDMEATPINRPKHLYHVEEFGVDEHHKRMGIATELIRFLKADAKDRGYSRIDLDVWEFNEDALAFYENTGFHAFHRYMELYTD